MPILASPDKLSLFPPAYLGPWIGSMCTGYGGLDLAVMEVYGARLAWCADNDPHAAKLLAERFPVVPNLGDLTQVDWTTVPRVDIVTAGFPCTDISYAGRGAGLKEDTRSGLWFTIAHALRILRPSLVFVENVPALRSRGLDRVLGDLAALGYDTVWACLRASDIGAPHRRERLFILAAHPDSPRPSRRSEPGDPQGEGPHGEPHRRGLHPPTPNPSSVQPQRWGDAGLLAAAQRPPAPDPCPPPGDRGQAASNTTSQRHRHGRAQAGAGIPPAAVGSAPTDPEGQRRNQGVRPADRLPRPPDAARDRLPDWGPYEPAISRWERVFDRSVPNPTELGTRGQPRLSARFVEWMMGLPNGWVTDIEIPRTAQMRVLGNGVVPLQAVSALDILASRFDGTETTWGAHEG
ncbi:DNA (cytosine-5-)-methyltransferase [Nonomuraea sp. NPDC050556]|uniref:DNA (cytosine-5-)-methyltransferase n=1 Tax=Nonomuraea sp. NPDC050556 TaxID=3364369 RepID=UPI0037984F3A